MLQTRWGWNGSIIAEWFFIFLLVLCFLIIFFKVFKSFFKDRTNLHANSFFAVLWFYHLCAGVSYISKFSMPHFVWKIFGIEQYLIICNMQSHTLEVICTVSDMNFYLFGSVYTPLCTHGGQLLFLFSQKKRKIILEQKSSPFNAVYVMCLISFSFFILWLFYKKNNETDQR